MPSLGFLGVASGVFQGLHEKVLDLAVDAAQFIGRPALESVEQLGIDPQQK